VAPCGISNKGYSSTEGVGDTEMILPATTKPKYLTNISPELNMH
jgi:hypothetical protein